MKKIVTRTLSLVLVLLMAMGVTSAFAAGKAVVISEKNFPDATFRKYVKQFDANNDGKLSAAEIEDAKGIYVNGKKAIKSLKGIEYFTALENLYCRGTSVKSLDLRKNTSLVYLQAEKPR